MMNPEMDMGPQPLAEILDELGLKSADLVKASGEHLTHKVVRKGCKGRKLTHRAQCKILNALNALVGEENSYTRDAIFNYHGT